MSPSSTNCSTDWLRSFYRIISGVKWTGWRTTCKAISPPTTRRRAIRNETSVLLGTALWLFALKTGLLSWATPIAHLSFVKKYHPCTACTEATQAVTHSHHLFFPSYKWRWFLKNVLDLVDRSKNPQLTVVRSSTTPKIVYEDCLELSRVESYLLLI